MTQRARIETPLKRVLEQEGRKQTWLARELSKRLGRSITRGQVGSWAHGIHVPEHATREAIARALGRTTAELWPGEDDDMDKAA